jgi:predicted Zn-dependent peptidase
VTGSIKIDSLENGLTVIVEEMPHVESAAYELLIPGGILTDHEHAIGASLILAELTSRGAGALSARELMEKFDDLGVRHGESAGHDRCYYSGGLVADTLPEALKLVSLMVREPSFPEEEIDPIRSIFLQDIASIKDNPSRRASTELSERYYPAPYNRPSTGTIEGLGASTLEHLKNRWQETYCPKGAILSVAGKVTNQSVLNMAKDYFGSWQGNGKQIPSFGEVSKPTVYHIDQESSQLQILLAYPSAVFGDPDYYAAKVVAGILSGGMFGRLFIEVREKRGLVYSVYARHSATKDYGIMSVYAGTTPERAQETLDITLRELSNLKGSVTEIELERAKANIKASVIMGNESSGSRASSSAGDYWLLKRVRSLDEIQAEIDKVTLSDVDRVMQRFSADNYSLLTLGSKPLMPVGARSVTGRVV